MQTSFITQQYLDAYTWYHTSSNSWALSGIVVILSPSFHSILPLLTDNDNPPSVDNKVPEETSPRKYRETWELMLEGRLIGYVVDVLPVNLSAISICGQGKII